MCDLNAMLLLWAMCAAAQARVCSIVDYGAVGDGRTINTIAITTIGITVLNSSTIESATMTITIQHCHHQSRSRTRKAKGDRWPKRWVQVFVSHIRASLKLTRKN